MHEQSKYEIFFDHYFEIIEQHNGLMKRYFPTVTSLMNWAETPQQFLGGVTPFDYAKENGLALLDEMMITESDRPYWDEQTANWDK